MSDPINLADITPEILDRMVEEGKASLFEVMPGRWSIKIGDEVVGSVNTDQLMGEQVVSVGGRELGRFTDR